MSEQPDTLPQSRQPLVSRSVSRSGPWIFAGAALLGGVLLFMALESRRTTVEVPAIAPEPGSDNAMIVSPPELALPPAWQGQPQATASDGTPLVQPSVAALVPSSAPHMMSTAGKAPPVTETISGPVQPLVSPSPVPGAPEIIYDSGVHSSSSAAKADASGGGGDKAERVEATRFANPGTTVPKGTIIQAVLESALDSTRAGMARAIVSHDIYGFDGARVLIPRGSRLIGEYKADVQQGQNRALIQWQRLMRPDGAIINLDSPSADPLGRAGIKGKVNGHFIQRYGGAILQTALNVGQEVAVDKLAPSATAIYAMPTLMPNMTNGTGQNTGLIGQNIQPTLTVKQGTSISVFVARDLDFTGVER